jgi:hypothetical protein
MILLRATSLSSQLLDFAHHLRAASQLDVAFVFDARFAQNVEDFGVIALSPEKLQQMGLYCPKNFAWRCGDYGYYLAQTEFPGHAHYWMIEHDVRFNHDGAVSFFDKFRAVECDFLSSYLRPADGDWYWRTFGAASDVAPYRALFPVTRLSQGAIAALLTKRREHAQQWQRRLLWANDELFAATTLMANGLSCRDLNSYGAPVYDEAEYSFETVFEGSQFENDLAQRSGIHMFHSVLYGDDYHAKIAKLAHYEQRSERLKTMINLVKKQINLRRKW